MTIYVPKGKIDKVKLAIDTLLHCIHKPVCVRSVASVVGQIIAMKLVVGPVSQLMTRSISIDILKARSWYSKIVLSDMAINQLKFWHENIENYDSRTLVQSATATTVVYSDASDVGFAGYIVNVDCVPSCGHWSSEEAKLSSTWRELKAAQLVFESLISKLTHPRVKWFTDNENVVNIITKGNMKQYLQSIALRIFDLCLKYCVELEVQWIPHCANQIADFLSRLPDCDGWGVSQDVFHKVDAIWGPHHVDRFASYYNKKMERFNSKFSNPGSQAVDCFTVNWKGTMSWIVPPIPRVIKPLKECCAAGTLVVPEWPSACFWPLICTKNVFISQIKDWMYLPTDKDAYTASRIQGGLFGEKDLTEVFQHVYRDELSDLPENVRALADDIPWVLSGARADSTNRKYQYGFSAWKRWAICNKISCDLPVSPLHCALYLVSVMQQSESFSSVVTTFYSLRYVHSSLGFVSPTENGLVKNVLEGAKRKLAKVVIKKEPITVSILERMYDDKIQEAGLPEIRLLSMCLLAYAGFLRSAELLYISRSDVVFCQSHIFVFIEKSKTDIYRDGAWIVIGRTHTKLCPVACLERYLDMAAIDSDSDQYIFRGFWFDWWIVGVKMKENV
ncbi:uncharacterized protein [Haliotis asinina]|uniref:uncharacterized protein n=1 Tax=Haliotis asinina TaxID=109174 RepID=UPI0035319CCA